MKKITLPIVFEVANRTPSDIKDFDLLDLSKKNLPKDQEDVVFELDSFDFTYSELCEFLDNNEISFKNLHIQSPNSSQMYSLIQFKNKKGKETLMPNLDSQGYYPMRYKHNGLTLDNETVIKVKKLLGYATIKLYLS